MEGSAIRDDSTLDPPVRIFERLSQIPGYNCWDESKAPVHSSYDNWYALRELVLLLLSLLLLFAFACASLTRV